ADDGIRDRNVTGVQTCALLISEIDIILLTVKEITLKVAQPKYQRTTVGFLSILKCRQKTNRKFNANSILNCITQFTPRINECIKIGRASCREREEIST